MQLSSLIFSQSPIGETSGKISPNLFYFFNPFSFPLFHTCHTFHWGTAASFRKQSSHCKTRRPPIDVRVNERRPRQQRVTEPGDKRFTPRRPLPSPGDRPLEFRGWLWLSTANECATGSAFWSITRARGYCRLVKQHLDPAGKRAEGFSFWTALSGRGVPYGRKLATLECRGWRQCRFTKKSARCDNSKNFWLL